jgi:hypothetical protein
MDGRFDPSFDARAQRDPRASGDGLTPEARQRIPLSQDQSGFALALGWLVNAVARLPIWPLRAAPVRVRDHRAEPRL